MGAFSDILDRNERSSEPRSVAATPAPAASPLLGPHCGAAARVRGSPGFSWPSDSDASTPSSSLSLSPPPATICPSALFLAPAPRYHYALGSMAAVQSADAVAMSFKSEPESEHVLTYPISSGRQLAALSAHAHYPHSTYPTETIFSQLNNINDNQRHDVWPVNVSLSDTLPTSSVNNHLHLESQQLPSSSSSHQYDPINTQQPRLRTSPHHPVQRNPSLLAAHHGIPTFLPPPPVPKSKSSSSLVPHSTIADPLTHNLSLSYQAMLASSSHLSTTTIKDDTISMPPPASPRTLEQVLSDKESMEELYRHVVELASSPEFAPVPEFTPEMAFDTTPNLEFLTSPVSGEPGMMDELHTPLNEPDDLTALLSAQFEFADGPLFGGCMPPVDDSFMTDHFEKAAPQLPSTLSPLDSLYTLSPHSPYINPSALTSPANMPINDITPPTNGASGSRSMQSAVPRKKVPTGTRKNVTPSTLIPEHAPIQNRTYVLPSTTSRKALPQTFARKRSRTVAFDEDDDELDAEDAGDAQPSTTEEAAIIAKRRQNTLAARRSRRRKLEYQMELENALDDQKKETDKWKGRAESLKAILFSTGIPCPVWED